MSWYAVMLLVVGLMVGTYCNSIRLGVAAYLGLSVIVLAIRDAARTTTTKGDSL